MNILTKSEELDLGFTGKLKSALPKLDQEIDLLTQELDLINLFEESKPDEILIGSKVLIVLDKQPQMEGRVWGKKKSTDEYEVNRDGFKNYMNISRKNLTNLSTGFIGQLERQLWIAKQRKLEYTAILDNTDLPIILQEQTFNIIEVIEIDHCYPCNKISFILGSNLRSGTIKIPQDYIKELGFYEIEVKNNTIVGVKKSNKYAFENLRE